VTGVQTCALPICSKEQYQHRPSRQSAFLESKKQPDSIFGMDMIFQMDFTADGVFA